MKVERVPRARLRLPVDTAELGDGVVAAYALRTMGLGLRSSMRGMFIHQFVDWAAPLYLQLRPSVPAGTAVEINAAVFGPHGALDGTVTQLGLHAQQRGRRRVRVWRGEEAAGCGRIRAAPGARHDRLLGVSRAGARLGHSRIHAVPVVGLDVGAAGAHDQLPLEALLP